jgi:hypothetical protein
MGDIGNTGPRIVRLTQSQDLDNDPASPETLAWARAVSREILAEHRQLVHSHDFTTPCLDVTCYTHRPGTSIEPEQLALMQKLAAQPARPEAPADPAAEIEATLRAYDEAVAAGDFTLPDAPARAPGTCEYCYGPVGKSGGTVCQRCRAGSAERLAADTRHPVPALRDDHPLNYPGLRGELERSRAESAALTSQVQPRSWLRDVKRAPYLPDGRRNARLRINGKSPVPLLFLIAGLLACVLGGTLLVAALSIAGWVLMGLALLSIAVLSYRERRR